MNDLQKLIFATSSYYDLFDFTLTAEEIKKYLVASRYLKLGVLDLEAIDAELYSLVNTDRLDLAEGYYTLPKREHLVPLRVRRNKIAVKKMRRTKIAAYIMSSLPYIRAVFASGSLALGATDYDSDLDIFIVAKSGRIWTARFITNAIFDIIGWKRKPNHSVAPDKLCLNHWITDEIFKISNQNMFTARVYSHLVPIYVQNPKIVNDFQKTNEWIYGYINQWDFSKKHLIKNYSFFKFVKKARETILNTKLGDLVEFLAKKYQIKRIERNPLTNAPQGRIKYSDHQLEFHPHSIENSVLEKYRENITELSLGS